MNNKQYIAVATFAYVMNKNNEVLVLRRAKHDSFPGTWELPGGGLEYKEHPQESIEREVLEEAGLHVKALKPIAVITHNGFNKNKHIVRIIYQCELLDDKEQVKLSHEHDAYQWVPENSLLHFDEHTLLYQVASELQKNSQTIVEDAKHSYLH